MITSASSPSRRSTVWLAMSVEVSPESPWTTVTSWPSTPPPSLISWTASSTPANSGGPRKARVPVSGSSVPKLSVPSESPVQAGCGSDRSLCCSASVPSSAVVSSGASVPSSAVVSSGASVPSTASVPSGASCLPEPRSPRLRCQRARRHRRRHRRPRRRARGRSPTPPTRRPRVRCMLCFSPLWVNGTGLPRSVRCVQRSRPSKEMRVHTFRRASSPERWLPSSLMFSARRLVARRSGDTRAIRRYTPIRSRTRTSPRSCGTPAGPSGTNRQPFRFITLRREDPVAAPLPVTCWHGAFRQSWGQALPISTPADHPPRARPGHACRRRCSTTSTTWTRFR